MTEKSDIAVLQRDVKYIKEGVDDIKENTVSKGRFRPVELITYGLAGGVLLWALNQVLATVALAKSFF